MIDNLPDEIDTAPGPYTLAPDRQKQTEEILFYPLQTTGLMWQKETKRRQVTDRYKKKTRDRKDRLPKDKMSEDRRQTRDRKDFYYSRFYRQINLSSLYSTQVTFEDLPWFISSINKTDSEDRGQVQNLGPKFQFQILVSIPRSNPQKDLTAFLLPFPERLCTLLYLFVILYPSLLTDSL